MIIDITNDKVVLAYYGLGKNIIDVLPVIENVLKNNVEKKIIVSNETFKKDPIFGKPKQLVLKLKSETKIIVKEDNEILFLINNTINELDKKKNIIENNTDDTIDYNDYNDYLRNISKMSDNKNYLISTNVRDEPNIIEWIIYHLLLGFDQIFIIDHLSKYPVKKLIENYRFKNKITVFESSREGPVKMFFLNDIILPYAKENNFKYLIHLDCDEYLNLNNNFNNVDELINYYQSDILAINCLNFGSSFKKTNTNQNNFLIPEFKKCNNTIDNIFKCFIKINDNIDKFLTPQIIINKSNDTKYTNIDKNGIYYHDKFFFNKITPKHDNLSKFKCFINHYLIQSEEDYYRRKIKRNDDYLNKAVKFDKNILVKYNNRNCGNINQKYSDIINYIFNKGKITIAFIILRYVRDNKTNSFWQKCYSNIRKYYNNPIYIIDDNSNKKYLTNLDMVNTKIIESEFPRRGELLPYIYFLKYKFSDRIIVLHDNMWVQQFINFNEIINYNGFTRLFSFGNGAYKIDIKYFEKQTSFLKNGDIILKHHQDKFYKLIGCFGVCYIIDYDFLLRVEEKYNISNLVNCISKRDHRKTLERLLSCIFDKEICDSNIKSRPSLLGDIQNNISKQKNNKNIFIKKMFCGR